jgi:hypothetical protein
VPPKKKKKTITKKYKYRGHMHLTFSGEAVGKIDIPTETQHRFSSSAKQIPPPEKKKL